jgi:hypothetical protein
MKIFSKQSIWNEAKFIFFAVLAIVIQSYFLCISCRSSLYKYSMVTTFCLCMWLFLWRGNSLLTRYINTKISWLEFPVWRFIIGVIATVGYTAGIIFLTIEFFDRVLNFNFGSSAVPTIYYSVLFTVIISLFLHGREFFFNWRKLELDAAKLRNENLSSRYESLKSQVDPHFLFNSLNVLTNLVYEDADKSAKFIKQLSEVYRYVLDTRSKELVSVEEELKFVNAYLYLQQIRFGDKLIIENRLNGVKGVVPPLALQMLAENAIKHNIISEENPLKIKLYKVDESIVIENNLQRKSMSDEISPGIGLDNIRKRYEFLSQKNIQVTDTGDTFKVAVPLLEVKD